jgi:phosphomannomutase
MNAFKAYDIRGVFGQDFAEQDVEKIGFFLPKLLNAKQILVGRDDRASSPVIFEALCKGITEAGADVISIGLATTPTVYFAVASHGYDAGVQITASHNPPEYNGLKVCRTEARPVDFSSGLEELKRLCETEPIIPVENPGQVIETDVREDYLNLLRTYLPDLSGLKIGIDCSNGMAALLVKELFGTDPVYIFDEIDGTFPNHPPNPLEEKNCDDLKKLVLENNLDIGLIFDGDGDRVMFVDEQGNYVQPDLITAVLAEYYLADGSATVLHDVRTSKAVDERIKELGGTPHMWKVGHSFAKQKMRELDCVVGGELAGHYYFRDFFYCDSGLLTALIVLQVAARLKAEGKPFSSDIDELRRYANSGELNYRIDRKDDATAALIEAVTRNEKALKSYSFDGIRLEFTNWWFNVRISQTEPYLRLVIEAETQDLLTEKRALLESVLKEFL